MTFRAKSILLSLIPNDWIQTVDLWRRPNVPQRFCDIQATIVSLTY